MFNAYLAESFARLHWVRLVALVGAPYVAARIKSFFTALSGCSRGLLLSLRAMARSCGSCVATAERRLSLYLSQVLLPANNGWPAFAKGPESFFRCGYPRRAAAMQGAGPIRLRTKQEG
jgi:hypothetical protein